MTHRLKNALNGHDVDFQDTSECRYRHSLQNFLTEEKKLQ